MKLSIVIVNYNVRHFLEQCLRSVETALRGMDGEVFVVDNNSVDDSLAMVSQCFPWVNIIANHDNFGFSRANNQAIRQSSGEYVLLLNPDTIIEEDTLRKIVEFMDQTPDAGALGCRMVDGQGNFLPESKRSLPTPWVAFYKIFGLSKLYPKSPRFGKYHLTYLPENETNPVEVLSGAFMLLRKSVLDEIGLLDEDYFMYGEDVDLSYRVTQAGYENYYFAGTRIIHYKGESTKKGSLNYVLVFYRAMLIFVRKHFQRGPNRVLSLLIKSAIYFRAGLSITKRLAQRSLWPALEFLLLTGVVLLAQTFWTDIHPKTLPEWFDYIIAPGYALMFVAALALLGNYSRPFKIRNVVGGIAGGFLGIVLVNYLFPQINFSRMIVGLSTVGSLLVALLNRGIANYIHSGNFFLDQKARRRTLIAGSPAEAERVAHLMADEILYNCTIVGRVTRDGERPPEGTPVAGRLSQLADLVRLQNIDEVVFCNASLSTADIIEQMSRLADRHVEFKIVPAGADYLIGPNTVLIAPGNQPLRLSLAQPRSRRRKALFDRGLALGLLLGYPLLFWMYHRPGTALRNIWNVLMGQTHLVGYIDGTASDLPELSGGLLDMRQLNAHGAGYLSKAEIERLDRQYARNYSPALDWQIFVQGLRHIGDRTRSAARKSSLK